MNYHSRMDPVYQMYDHPASINRDKMYSFWKLVKHLDENNDPLIEKGNIGDLAEQNQDGKQEEKTMKASATKDKDTFEFPQHEIFHEFHIIYKMRKSVEMGEPGLF